MTQSNGRKATGGAAHLTATERDEILREYFNGLNQSQLARKFGRTREAIGHCLKRDERASVVVLCPLIGGLLGSLSLHPAPAPVGRKRGWCWPDGRCKRGHLLAEVGIYTRPNGARNCAACYKATRKAALVRWQQRNRLKVANYHWLRKNFNVIGKEGQGWREAAIELLNIKREVRQRAQKA